MSAQLTLSLEAGLAEQLPAMLAAAGLTKGKR